MAETNGVVNGESGSHSIKTSQPAEPTVDTGASRRPRDARTIHLILASMGVTAYQERVPLALMDIAFRYTSSVLQDALLYWDAAHPATTTGQPPPQITMADLRMAISSKVNHQFVTAPPKEFMLDVAQERNKVALPPVGKDWGVRLPPEQYCLTGVNWELLAEPLDDGDDEEEDAEGEPATADAGRADRDEGDEEMPDAVADMFGENGDGDHDQDMMVM
ncbi:Transcription initiation factor [Drechslerella dactyloides]|uniref:Transcription initiation factor n=1 Tax=Drechslerella dactyloides TaxID=74499 RepID=A0AAD6J4Z2_DREDA|nr:Transcription initiation factor [Drechslerella dactyloides]